jgi:hypothetical protein
MQTFTAAPPGKNFRTCYGALRTLTSTPREAGHAEEAWPLCNSVVQQLDGSGRSFLRRARRRCGGDDLGINPALGIRRG